MKGIIYKSIFFWWKLPLPSWSKSWINARNSCYLYVVV